jgi:hypothetical protein
MLLTGYLSEWTMSKLGTASVAATLQDIDFTKYDRIMMNQLRATSSSNPALYSTWGIGQYATWIDSIHAEIAAQGASTKLMVCIYDDPSFNALTGIVNNATYRAAFVTNVHNFIDAHSLDGADLDWEDVSSYGTLQETLIQALYDSLNPHSHYVSVAGAPEQLNGSVAILDAHTDFINVMAYDITPNPAHSSYEKAVAAMELWSDAGFTKSKLLMGVPCYAKDSTTSIALWCDCVRELDPTDAQQSEAVASIYVPWQTPTTYTVAGGTLWYGGRDLAVQKATYARNNSYGGCMTYDVGQDEWLTPSKGFTGVLRSTLDADPGLVPITINKQVAASADDWFKTASEFDATNITVYSGNSYESADGGYRFLGVTIPQYSTVISAYLSVKGYGTGGVGTPLTKLSAVDALSPAAPTSIAEHNALTLTTAKVDWDPAIPASGIWINSPDITAIIQELVTSYDLSNSAVIIMQKDDSSAAPDNYLRVASWDTDPTFSAKLHIEYYAPYDTQKVMGVTGPASVMGVLQANIKSVMGVVA